MAQIPLGNFGQVVPRGAPVVTSERTMRAQGQLFETAGAIAQQYAQDDLRFQEAAKREVLEERKRQAEQAEMAARARESAALYDVEDRLTDVHDDVATRVLSRQLDRDAAEPEYTQRSREVIDSALSQMRPESRELVGARLNRSASKFGNSIRRAVEKRDRQDTTAAIDKNLETFERMYLDDPAKATALAAGTIEKLGPFSDLPPDVLGRRLQAWKEKTQGVAARTAVNGALGNLDALTRAEKAIGELPDLDPGLREQQMQRIAVERTRIAQEAELKAQRAERLYERKLRIAEHAANAVQALADKGTALDPKFVEQQLKATDGTPYQAVVFAAAQQAAQSGGQAAKSLAQQEADLRSIDAQIATQGRSPELDKRRERVEKILRGAESDRQKEGGLAAYAQRTTGFVPAPLDVTGGLPSIVQGLRARSEQAEEVSAWSGRPESPLLPAEAEVLRRGLETLAPKDKAQWLATISGVIGSRAALGLAEQIDPKDKALSLALAVGSRQTTTDRFVSELILRGQHAKSTGTSTKDENKADYPPAQWRTLMSRHMNGRDGQPLFGNARFEAQVLDAAEFIAHGIASEQQGKLDKDDLKRAVRLAIGGEVVEHNGRRIPLPAGVDERALEQRLRSVTADEIAQQAPGGAVRAAGVAVPVAEFVKALPGQQLMPVRPGEFAVLVGGRPVTNAEGVPVIVRVR